MGREEIRPPVYIDESGDVSIFKTIEEAEAYLEPIDVERGRYVGYDSSGRLLRLLATSPRITITTDESQGEARDKLVRLLVDFLKRTGLSGEWSEASLEELTEKSLEFATESKSPIQQIRDLLS